ncbi:MAG: CotH kinase family protein, partial [Clostridia bacterium]|nr:CotH kinase family protein [Clostridia bacterium]
AFVSGVEKYINVDAAIDSMIVTYLANGRDNIAKNILWSTFDGVKWAPTIYDLDMTWGITDYGKGYIDAHLFSPKGTTRNNLLYQKLYTYMYDRVKARYNELRGTVFTLENVRNTFTEFQDRIPPSVMNLERSKWTNVPSISTNNIEQIMKYAEDHFAVIDSCFK